jgi:hypothetical protein
MMQSLLMLTSLYLIMSRLCWYGFSLCCSTWARPNHQATRICLLACQLWTSYKVSRFCLLSGPLWTIYKPPYFAFSLVHYEPPTSHQSLPSLWSTMNHLQGYYILPSLWSLWTSYKPPDFAFSLSLWTTYKQPDFAFSLVNYEPPNYILPSLCHYEPPTRLLYFAISLSLWTTYKQPDFAFSLVNYEPPNYILSSLYHYEPPISNQILPSLWSTMNHLQG